MRTKKRLDYTLVAEGFAEYAFIPTYLRRIAELYNVQSVPSRIDLKKKQPSKSKVLAEAGKLCTAAISEDHDLFIAGIDLDRADHEKEQPHHKMECKKLSDAMNSFGKVYTQYKEQIILYVPVQAIEHWLAYQAYKIKLTNSFPTDGVESKPQGELKKLLYQSKEDQFNMQKVAKEIAEMADFEELARQSRSFCHFHEQVKSFLTTFSA